MPHTPQVSSVSRRQVAKGAAWSIPALTVAAAAPAMAGSPTPGALTGITGFYSANPVNGCNSSGPLTGVQPTAGSTNPAPYVYVSTGVALGAQTGTSVGVTISLHNAYDAQGGTLANRVTFVPGTYTYEGLTATSTCNTTNAQGACTSINVVWDLSGVGTTANNPQNAPFRVGLLPGTTVPSGDEVATGFTAAVLGGGPAPVNSDNVVAWRAGSYTGSYTCAP